MQVSLRPEAQRFVEDQVRSGRYQSADEVLDDALMRMMEEQSSVLDDRTLAAIDESEDQIEKGEYREWKQVSAELRAKSLNK
jgi:putative addiction module CopG family antidote